MPWVLLLFLLLALMIRLGSIVVSIRHERALMEAGAAEFDIRNSTILALAHVAFYFASPIEGWLRSWPVNFLTLVGMLLYAFGMLWLGVVIALLGRLWTVKLILAQDHVLVTHPVFRTVRHPNYFLNILPELVGYAVTFSAWITLIMGLAVYAVPLVRRIRAEEAAMSARFAGYS